MRIRRTKIDFLDLSSFEVLNWPFWLADVQTVTLTLLNLTWFNLSFQEDLQVHPGFFGWPIPYI